MVMQTEIMRYSSDSWAFKMHNKQFHGVERIKGNNLNRPTRMTPKNNCQFTFEYKAQYKRQYFYARLDTSLDL